MTKRTKQQQLEAMKQTKLTQKDLAGMVGYSGVHINNYFLGKLNGKFQLRDLPVLSDKIDRAIDEHIDDMIEATKIQHKAELSLLIRLKSFRVNPETDGGGE